MVKKRCGKQIVSSQSPINIEAENYLKATSADIKFNYTHEQLFEVKHSGHTISCTPSSQNYIIVDEQRYNLVEFHFHVPSEHQVNGQSFSGEIHFVHKNDAGELAVVGVFIQATDSAAQDERTADIRSVFERITQSVTQEGQSISVTFSNVS